MSILLRDYQQDAVDAIRDSFRRRNRRVLFVGACAFGKTQVVSHIMESALRKDKRVIFLVDRISLVEQTSKALWDCGIEHGVIQSDNSFNRNSKILICSEQTLQKRGYMSDADLIIRDECHSFRVSIQKMLMKSCRPVIGMTATPFTPGMADFYDDAVYGTSTNQLIDKGYLKPLKVYIAKSIDHSKLRMNWKKGEYTAESAAEAGRAIVGDIVSEWVKHTYMHFDGPVKTLCFVPTVDYGAELSAQFAMAGYHFRHVSYKDDAETNRRSIELLQSGKIHGLISVAKLVKGFNVPDVQCLISARPYSKSLTDHIQQLGRGMRAFPGQKYCLVLDHVSNYSRFASLTEAFWDNGYWPLSWNDKARPVKNEKQKKAEKERQDERRCRSCNAYLKPGVRTCPSCGFTNPRRRSLSISFESGSMRAYRNPMDYIRKTNPGVNLWAVLCTIALRRHTKDMDKAMKFARAQYRAITGVWPTAGILFDFTGEYDSNVEELVNRLYEDWSKRRRKGRIKRYYASKSQQQRRAELKKDEAKALALQAAQTPNQAPN